MDDSTVHVHDDAPEADDADTVMAALVDARNALHTLQHLALSAQCVGCDPAGQRSVQIGMDLLERFDVDRVEADFLLADAADARTALMGLLLSMCDHDHDDSGEHQ